MDDLHPTQVHSRSPSTDPLQSPRVGLDKYPSTGQHDPMHHPSCDPRTKFNLQHREALRSALGSILAPKRPSLSGSRSSSGTASPAYSFSGSSGSYTPATPPAIPYTPSLDASNSQELSSARIHLPHPHYHPTHPPSRLGRVESKSSAPADIPTSIPIPNTPPQHHSPPIVPPHPLFRSRSHTIPPSSRTTSRVPPLTPPLAPTHPATTLTDTADLGPPLSPPLVVATSSSGGGKINAAGNLAPPPSTPFLGSPAPLPTTEVYQTTATAPNGEGGSGQAPNQQHPAPPGPSNGAATPRAKFLQTLQGKSAWDALIHGSFS